MDTSSSYAAIVKKSLCNQHIETAIEPKSWFNESEDCEKNMVRVLSIFELTGLMLVFLCIFLLLRKTLLRSRSVSLSTILSSDDNATLCHMNVRSHSIAHSLDSGRSSDLSSDYEPSSKSLNKNDDIRLDDFKYQSNAMLHRRDSFDSCRTSSTVISLDRLVNEDQLKEMSKRWEKVKKEKQDIETDTEILARRQKQIDYGKNTIGYQTYTEQVPSAERTRKHPMTPNKNLQYSRRVFDGLIKSWRKQLHKFDPENSKEV